MTRLSDREQYILSLIAQGCSNKEIACRLSSSEPMVKLYVRSIFKKLNARNRTQAAIWALGQALP